MTNDTFIGRSEELAELRHLLDRGRIVALVGPGGIGKSTLARHLAVLDSPLYRGGIHFIEGYEIGNRPSYIAEQLREQLRLQSQRGRTLLVLDGIDELGPDTASAVLDLAKKRTKNLRTLVTSRRVVPEADSTVSLNSLSHADVVQLLRSKGLLQADAEEVAAALDGHPLAASLAAAAIREGHYTSAEFLRYLQDFTAAGIVRPDGHSVQAQEPTSAPIRLDIITINEELLRTLDREIHRARDLSPRKFEELVSELLARQGYTVELTPASKDGGKDIYAAKRDDLGTFLYLVECKKYALDNPVGVEIVRALHGTVQAERATAGILVTTSVFTRGARDFQRHLQHQLSLRDYIELHKWVRHALRSES